MIPLVAKIENTASTLLGFVFLGRDVSKRSMNDVPFPVGKADGTSDTFDCVKPLLLENFADIVLTLFEDFVFGRDRLCQFQVSKGVDKPSKMGFTIFDTSLFYYAGKMGLGRESVKSRSSISVFHTTNYITKNLFVV